MHEKYKNVNLNKYKDLMSKCHRTKCLSKGIMIVCETNGPQICCIPHWSLGLPK